MKKIVLNPIKSRISALLKTRGLKAELARKLGFKPESITDMLKKSGDPPIHYVQAVSQLTGKSVDWILTGSEVPGKTSEAIQPSSQHVSEIEKLEMLVASQKRTIELLDKEVMRLENELKQKVNKI